MLLPDHEIQRLCEQQGMIAPFCLEQLNPASYDVRLGTEVMVESVKSRAFVRASIADFTKDDPWYLDPGQFCLASTEEVFNMPGDVAGHFALKSSRGREGYSHALSAYIDPGFHGSRLTLELHNLRQLHPLPLYPGMLIGQIVFSLMSSTPKVGYAEKGHYNNNPSVMPSIWEG
jgi:dCTP deaminase